MALVTGSFHLQQKTHILMWACISFIAFVIKVNQTGDFGDEKRDLTLSEIPFHGVFIGFEIMLYSFHVIIKLIDCTLMHVIKYISIGVYRSMYVSMTEPGLEHYRIYTGLYAPGRKCMS